jgi:hypothetical protein
VVSQITGDEEMMNTENTMGMTLHEADAFRNMLDKYFDDRHERASGGAVKDGVTFRTLAAYVDGLLAAKDAEITALKTREKRFIRHCDAMNAAFKDVFDSSWGKDSEKIILQILMEYPELQLATISNPGTDWYHLTQDQILDSWVKAEISEGLAAHLLDVGRIQARMMMEKKHGVYWRDLADSGEE